MGINSQGTSGEAKLGKKNGPAARVTRHEEILIKGYMIQTEMLMKSYRIKQCTYMYIALLFFPSACEDKNQHCKSWALHGECEKNPNVHAVQLLQKLRSLSRYACVQVII